VSPSARPRPPARAATALALLAALLLGACASHPSRYYENDGPPAHPPADLASVPDAVPRVEPANPNANRPYTALGRRYVPDTGDAPFEQRGMASWYGRQYHGSRTSSGEIYDMYAMTAAHPTLPIPSYARVTSVRDGRSVVVRINDRGPFIEDRVIDLSYAAAVRLGIAAAGSGEVTVTKLTARDIAQGGRAPARAAAAAPLPATATASSPAAGAPLPAPLAAPASAPAAIATAAAVVPLAAASAAVAVAPALAPSAPLAPLAAPESPADASAQAALGASGGGGDAPPAVGAAALPAPPEIAASPAPAPTPPADVVPVAPPAGGWSVQVGAFAVAEHAAALRDRIAARLAALAPGALPAEARSVRIELTGRLSRVLVGDPGERGAVQALAERLHGLLDCETSLYRR
jgi:rare lipoprotein A